MRKHNRVTGLVLTQPAEQPQRQCAALRCNRIQLDAMRDRANQPGFLFYAGNSYGLKAAGGAAPQDFAGTGAFARPASGARAVASKTFLRRY